MLPGSDPITAVYYLGISGPVETGFPSPTVNQLFFMSAITPYHECFKKLYFLKNNTFIIPNYRKGIEKRYLSILSYLLRAWSLQEVSPLKIYISENRKRGPLCRSSFRYTQLFPHSFHHRLVVHAMYVFCTLLFLSMMLLADVFLSIYSSSIWFLTLEGTESNWLLH